ncbi:hypothetical protein V5O48_011529 [Marasmius crinis-equi]|uniref:Coenzyme Q-binding protein COQ10 START domain-containing protein n=1 Tax=Marasmius crinis-equi TaxID=585013 RepID=A0ABR3F5L7_9AGAR
MKRFQWTPASLLIFAVLATAQNPPSHLPPVSPGVFNASASILINAPIDQVWNTLLDFPSYPEWNPFVRSQVVTDAFGIPLADQTPREGLYLTITSQIPPIEGPVDASTPSNPLQTQIIRERVTHVNTPEQYQAAWKFAEAPDLLLSAERWSVLSEVVSGSETLTFYESREVYDGPLAELVKVTYGSGLQEGFDAQATALKARVEG